MYKAEAGASAESSIELFLRGPASEVDESSVVADETKSTPDSEADFEEEVLYDQVSSIPAQELAIEPIRRMSLLLPCRNEGKGDCYGRCVCQSAHMRKDSLSIPCRRSGSISVSETSLSVISSSPDPIVRTTANSVAEIHTTSSAASLSPAAVAEESAAAAAEGFVPWRVSSKKWAKGTEVEMGYLRLSSSKFSIFPSKVGSNQPMFSSLCLCVRVCVWVCLCAI